MTLEERYNNAAPTTTAGRVRDTQEAGVGAVKGVNFMDGSVRSNTTDSLQSNFERRASDDTTVVQSAATTTYDAGERKGLSRWFGRALNYAFIDPKAPGNYLQNSAHTTFKSFRVGTKDAWSDNPGYFHRYTPTVTGKFAVSDTLSADAKIRATPKTVPTA